MHWRALAYGMATTVLVSVGLGVLVRMAGVAGLLALSLPNFTAVAAGSFVAGWVAGRTGAIHGAIVAGAYIFISGGFNLAVEIGFVNQGSAVLLPPMNMAGLLVADVILLSGAALAGALGDGLSRGQGRVQGAPHDPPT